MSGDSSPATLARLRHALDVLVEVLVDAVDEDRHRRLDRAQPRNQVAVGVVGAALQLARREVEQADEVVDDAAQLLRRRSGARGAGSTFRPSICPTCFSVVAAIAVSQTFDHGSERRREERERLLAEDLVADRLVEQVAGGQADRPRLALVEDALGLQQQRLAEALGADDDELVVAVRLRKPSISGVRCSRASSKSSATRMSSASTVHARIGPPNRVVSPIRTQRRPP